MRYFRPTRSRAADEVRAGLPPGGLDRAAGDSAGGRRGGDDRRGGRDRPHPIPPKALAPAGARRRDGQDRAWWAHPPRGGAPRCGRADGAAGPGLCLLGPVHGSRRSSATPSSTSAIGGTRRAHFRSSTATSRSFASRRATRFVDPEGGAPVLADPSMVASRYLAAWRRHRSALASIALAADVDLRETFPGPGHRERRRGLLAGQSGQGGAPMNLLQPIALFALPLVALPVVVHLLHRPASPRRGVGRDDVPARRRALLPRAAAASGSSCCWRPGHSRCSRCC